MKKRTGADLQAEVTAALTYRERIELAGLELDVVPSVFWPGCVLAVHALLQRPRESAAAQLAAPGGAKVALRFAEQQWSVVSVTAGARAGGCSLEALVEGLGGGLRALKQASLARARDPLTRLGVKARLALFDELEPLFGRARRFRGSAVAPDWTEVWAKPTGAADPIALYERMTRSPFPIRLGRRAIIEPHFVTDDDQVKLTPIPGLPLADLVTWERFALRSRKTTATFVSIRDLRFSVVHGAGDRALIFEDNFLPLPDAAVFNSAALSLRLEFALKAFEALDGPMTVIQSDVGP